MPVISRTFLARRRKDSAWITKLLLNGLLKGSFIPPKPIRDLRDLYRYKRKLLQQGSAERNRLQKILEDANIKLSSVLSDVFGVTGKLVIEAILSGQDDPRVLADCARGSLVRKRAVLSQALWGNVSLHHRYRLAASMQVLRNHELMVAKIDSKIADCTTVFAQEMSLLQTIPGVGPQAAIAILGEVGTDMSVFPSSKYLASWCGISPGNKESAGKNRSGRITQGDKFLKAALVESAWHACRIGGDSFLKRKFFSVAGRRGKKRAVIAGAHKMLIAAYFILKNRTPYLEPDKATYMEKRKQAQIKR